MSRNKGGNQKDTTLILCQCSACEMEAMALPGRHRACTRRTETREIQWVSEKMNTTFTREEGGGPAGRWYPRR